MSDESKVDASATEGCAAVTGSAVAAKAARYEIEQAIKRAETVSRRLRHSLMGRAYTIRKADADIVDLEIIQHLRRALVHLPSAELSESPAGGPAQP